MSSQTIHFASRFPPHPLAEKLKREVDGEVMFDAASRGRYATDASIYQIMPVGVVVPKTMDAARVAMQIAIEQGIPILPRGGGTSQCGQTVGAALVIDSSKHLNKLLDFNTETKRATVEPGMVLDHLNAKLKASGLWFPVDVSTAAQATIGGMAGNNSCGSRSIFYGNMVHNVAAIEAVLADGSVERFDDAPSAGSAVYQKLAKNIEAICRREAEEIRARFPKLLRRVAGYNLDIFDPQDPLHYNTVQPNLAHLLVGSEGTLAYFKSLELKLSPLPKSKVLGVVNFPTFYQSMALTQHIVKLGPIAVELVDRTMIDLARNNPAFRPTIDQALIGIPEAILLVEFAGDDARLLERKLNELDVLMSDLGLINSVVKMTHAGQQKDLWEVRKAGLNIMMSMRGEGKPVSFIEDCCVPLEHLAEYTSQLTEVFTKHGTKGTWYAHASVGTLHVRPILNMRADGAIKMRAIAEEAAVLVHKFKGVYSGEHGDGLVRSEWIAPFFRPKLTQVLGDIKQLFDPKNLLNPGKIVNPSKQDDRSLFRFQPGYATQKIDTALDWQTEGGFAGAIEMCNNNGTCRKFDAGTMCPSYRITGDEQHLTRGRANTLRLAISGQIGTHGLADDNVKEAMDLCVGCKGCKRECPTGVDMAKMKVEFLHHYKIRTGYTLRDKLIAYLPRYAPMVSKAAWFLNLRNVVPGAAWLSEMLTGLSAKRSLPKWKRAWQQAGNSNAPNKPHTKEVVLFADTFNRHFESENLTAACKVLNAAGYKVQVVNAKEGKRSLCCGRTFLATGMLDEAKVEARRTIDALLPYVQRGVAVVGLEPSCLLTLRDEFISLFPGKETEQLAQSAFLFEEFLVREKKAGRLSLSSLNLKPIAQQQALLHGHCHQKAFAVMGSVEEVLSWIPGLKTSTIESSCCGMAGAFGYEVEHVDASIKMGELSLLPAVRKADAATLIVADGTSCRHQIADGAKRDAVHVARVLVDALADASADS